MVGDRALEGKFVVLGITGGIAAYKAVEVCRQLVDLGAHVAPVMTEEATRFVGEVTFSSLASEPVRKSMWSEREPIPHTYLGQNADVIVVVPATARFIASYAIGLSDSLLASTVIATRAPVVVCPAMHTEMWEHPSVQENLKTLGRRGVNIVWPEQGRLAGGDTGVGRLAEPKAITEAVTKILLSDPLKAGPDREGPDRADPDRADSRVAAQKRDLEGVRILVTAGGTREPIDPVRFITNRSSGKQGHAIAQAAAERGATVSLVTSAPLDPPNVDRLVRVETAAEMEKAVIDLASYADVVVMAAAVADFRPMQSADHKIHKSEGIPELILEPTTDILAELGHTRSRDQVLVGFAAETEDALERASKKMDTKGVDVMVCNDVSAPGAGFDYDTNTVTILVAKGRPESTDEVPPRTVSGPKSTVAHAVLDTVARIRAQGGH